MSKQGLDQSNRELLKQCYLIKNIDPEGQRWSKENYLSGYTSYSSIDDLHLRFPHFEELKKKIDRHVRSFVRALDLNLQGGSLQMSTCWINIMGKTTTHSSHIHPLSVISGTYYVSIPKNSSGLKFEDPRHVQFMAAPPKKSKARLSNQPFVTLSPSAGDLALWESWLRHEVPPHQSTQDRVSISFNYEWR